MYNFDLGINCMTDRSIQWNIQFLRVQFDRQHMLFSANWTRAHAIT